MEALDQLNEMKLVKEIFNFFCLQCTQDYMIKFKNEMSDL